MSELNIREEKAAFTNGVAAVVLTIDGEISASSFGQYQETMLSYNDKKGVKLLVDMAAVSYINSTGMGLLIKLADELRNDQGDIFLIGLSEDVTYTMEMLGVLEFFKTFDSVAQCLATALSAKSGKADTAKTAQPVDQEIKFQGAFPQRTKCSGCGSLLSFGTQGTYVCPSCGVALIAEEDGRIRLFKSSASKTVTMALPIEFEWNKPIVQSVKTMCDSFEWDAAGTRSVVSAIDEAWSKIVSDKKGDHEHCHVIMIGSREGIICGLVMHTRKIADEKKPDTQILMKMLSGYMDVVQVKDIKPGGQILRMIKKRSSEETA